MRCTSLQSFGLVVIVLPMLLSGVFVVIQNIYLYCAVVRTITRSNNSSNKTAMRTARSTLKETKKASITLSILSGISILFGIIPSATSIIIQSQVGNDLFKAIWFSLVIAFAHKFNILLHSVLYGYFLHSIRQSLGLNNCQCF